MTLVASSRDETLLLTERGEVLVCRHLNGSEQQQQQQEDDELGYHYHEPARNNNSLFLVGSSSPSPRKREKPGAMPPLTEISARDGVAVVESSHQDHYEHEHEQQQQQEGEFFSTPANAQNNGFYHRFSNNNCGSHNNSSYSPTPVMSFDYHGYEPPTPESIRMPTIDAGMGSLSLYSPEPTGEIKKRERSHYYNIRPGKTSPDIIYDPSFSLPGVPKFLHQLTQIRITSLSAHPQGRHVLLISEEGLLFSYGSNDCGQLGLGVQPSGTTSVTIPSIVTPLLENGGKAINCAAGIDYSLVVVKTEGARIAQRQRQRHYQRRQQQNNNSTNNNNGSSPKNNNNGDRHRDYNCKAHHQMYGFGNNEHQKLGLLDPLGAVLASRTNSTISWSSNGDAGSPRRMQRSPEPLSPSSIVSSDSTEAGNNGTGDPNRVFLPRRVALHCKISTTQQQPSNANTNSLPKQSALPAAPPFGIFSIAASIHHSAALVRRPNGVIELYTWGVGREMALGTPATAAAAAASNRKTSLIVPFLNPMEYMVKVALTPACTHVITSRGRWLDLSSGSDGVSGCGSGARNPSLCEQFASVNIDEKHAVAVTSRGDGRSAHDNVPVGGIETDLENKLMHHTNSTKRVQRCVDMPSPEHIFGEMELWSDEYRNHAQSL